MCFFFVSLHKRKQRERRNIFDLSPPRAPERPKWFDGINWIQFSILETSMFFQASDIVSMSEKKHRFKGNEKKQGGNVPYRMFPERINFYLHVIAIGKKLTAEFNTINRRD